MNKNNLVNFLEWLITPQDDSEQKSFKEKSLVDDYIYIKNRIPEMSEKELIEEINKQLLPYKLEIKNNRGLRTNEARKYRR